MRPRTSTLVFGAVLVLLACGLLMLAWEYAFTWALSGGTYPGPVYVFALPLTIGAIVCVLVGRRLGQSADVRRGSAHRHSPSLP
jgi:hypothetical protein